jgi:hypothetical protein
MSKLRLAWLVLAFVPGWVMAQTKPVFTLQLRDVPWVTVVETIEAQSSYRFYFRTADTDSLLFSVAALRAPLEEVLAKAFAKTDLRYAIDPDNNVFITQGIALITALPKPTDTVPTRQSLRDYFSNEVTEKEKSLETKLIQIGKRTVPPATEATITGQIKNGQTGEALVGALVYIDQPRIGTSADPFGNYTLRLPAGRHELIIQSVGMRTTRRTIVLLSNGRLDVDMVEEVISLKEIVVEAERSENISGLQMGTQRLDVKTMRKIPSPLGEADIFKIMLSLPGVQSVGEGTSGINVRGGSADQNLILLDGTTIYNPTHLFGFFSAFNPDVLKNAELQKSGIPAEYGGRLAAILDVNVREGNKRKFQMSGGISPITGRLTLEAPLIKDKMSFLVGARSTYSDWLLRRVRDESLRRSNAGFYDANLRWDYDYNTRNHLTASAYISEDDFRFNNDTVYQYQNRTASLAWKHIVNKKLFTQFAAGYSGYRYSITSERDPINAFRLNYAIDQFNAKADVNYSLSSRHVLTAGAQTIRYQLAPGTRVPLGAESVIQSEQLQNEQGLEAAVHVSDQWEVSNKLLVYGGVRYSAFWNRGPLRVFNYDPETTKSINSIIDTTFYRAGETSAFYHGLEPRLSARYTVSPTSSVKVGYNRMRQYLQMLSNTTAIAPTDIWKLSDYHIRPLVGDQVNLGYYRNAPDNRWEFSVELYYKWIFNAVDFKSGTTLLLNQTIEADLVRARGKAYGVELLLKRNAGKLNGWISYTFSRTLLRTLGNTPSEIINRGAYYPGNFDKPHAVNVISNYRFNHRLSMTLNGTYSSGRPVTLPIAQYTLNGSPRFFYSERNQFRIPDYLRFDVGFNIEGNHKIRKLAHSSWTVSVYNLLGRRNAYSVFFQSEGGNVQGYRLAVFGTAIPTITYNFKFR